MSIERGLLLIVAGILFGLIFAVMADDALWDEQLKAGTFERGGVVYHVVPAP